MKNRKLSSLLVLVTIISSILLVSMVLSGFLAFFLVDQSIIPTTPENRLFLLVIYLLSVSFVTGTILALIGGDRFLRPFRDLTEATRQVAAGNFNIRVKGSRMREMNHLANNFNEMVKELSKTETLRADFISTISHEFKTPVVSIRGFARRLKKDNLTPQQRDEYLDIIISESERLTRLSASVLLLSRLESMGRPPERAPFSLDEQIRKAVLLLEPHYGKKRLEVDIHMENIKITASEEMLNHVWINLLSNAIKFCPEGGRIGVSLEKKGDKAVTTVSDTGIGMDEEVKKRIFEKFYQADSSRTTEGSGLGLSLVKKIVELENGTITVESVPGRGTGFTVSLPLTD